jgi:hypothetical protein
MTTANIINSFSRQRLPHRRPSITVSFEHFGLKYTCSFGRYADGRLAELFVATHKSGSSADCNVRDAAIAISIALQHGADPVALQRALSRDSQGRALSPIAQTLDLIASEVGNE